MTWVAVAIGGSAVVGAGGSYLASSQASKGSKGAIMPVSTNPGLRQLNYLFGQGTADPAAGYSSRGRPRNMLYGPGEGDVFGSSIYNTINSYLANPQTSYPGTTESIWDTLLGGPEGFQAGIDKFKTGMGGAVGTAAELTATGLPTDGTAYFNEAIRRLRDEVTPDLAEKSGFGTQGSGFLHGGYNAAADLLGQASLANIDLAEAATNRRMSAAPLLSTLLTAEQAVPLNLGSQMSDIFNAERLGPVNLFQSLYGMGTNTGQYIQPGYNPSSTGAGYSAAVGGLSGILNALGQWGQYSPGQSNYYTQSGVPSSTANGGLDFINSLSTFGGSGY